MGGITFACVGASEAGEADLDISVPMLVKMLGEGRLFLFKVRWYSRPEDTVQFKAVCRVMYY